MSPNNNLTNVKEESALEEGLSLPQDGTPASSCKKRLGDNRLSIISQKYDVDGDGQLDDTERAMRDMDKSGRGFLSNDKVYKILQEQMALQQQMFNMKRIIIGLSAFTLILALSNLGTAWAAAVLAKDTTVDSSGNMQAKSGTGMVGTEAKAKVFDAITEENDRRELDLYTDDGSSKVPFGIEAEVASCTGVTVRIKHTCTDGVTHFYDYNCGSSSYANQGGGTYTDGTVTISGCNDNKGTCNIAGLPCGGSVVLKPDGSNCYEGQECASGNCDGGNPPYILGFCASLVVAGGAEMPVEGGGGTDPTCDPACPVNQPSGDCTSFANSLSCSNYCYGGAGDCSYSCNGSTWAHVCF